MASTDARSEQASQTPSNLGADMSLEVVTLPVSDVDRAKAFYENLGWRLDIDFSPSEGVRALQFTPPHSPCSIQFSTAFTTAEHGTLDRLFLVVKDIHGARADLVSRGVEVTEVEDMRPSAAGSDGDPSYFLYASFKDPDGNGWLLQQITTRLPGREWEA
jgi:catechol 2,3-dioxygenase-like lactoylglutathione lyase family enzyme